MNRREERETMTWRREMQLDETLTTRDRNIKILIAVIRREVRNKEVRIPIKARDLQTHVLFETWESDEEEWMESGERWIATDSNSSNGEHSWPIINKRRHKREGNWIFTQRRGFRFATIITMTLGARAKGEPLVFSTKFLYFALFFFFRIISNFTNKFNFDVRFRKNY